jgi:MFS family permease
MSVSLRSAIEERRALPQRVAFWMLGGSLGMLMFASSAPSPLYPVYQAEWHFSATTLTAVFGVYAITLLIALLVAGSLSDHLGRRPVILGALLLDGAAMALFIIAHGVLLLFVARALQGVATGTATSALSAGLIETQPSREVPLAPLVNSAAPILGLAAGALGTSALVQYGPAPTRLIYWLLIAVFVIAILGVLAMAEPGKRRPGALASMRPRAALPREARGAFIAALPCLVALWALGGFYLSLGPSLASELERSSNHLWGGFAIFLLTGAGATASIVMRASTPRTAMTGGCMALLVGLAITIAGVATSTSAPFFLGSAIAGVGFGLAFLGVFRTLSALAPANQRAGLIASIYIVAYLAFSVPVLGAGVAATHAGLHDASLVYAAVLLVLVAIALAGLLIRGRSWHHAAHGSRYAAEPHIDLPPCAGTLPHHDAHPAMQASHASA